MATRQEEAPDPTPAVDVRSDRAEGNDLQRLAAESEAVAVAAFIDGDADAEEIRAVRSAMTSRLDQLADTRGESDGS